jgi:hypothetical protein
MLNLFACPADPLLRYICNGYEASFCCFGFGLAPFRELHADPPAATTILRVELHQCVSSRSGAGEKINHDPLSHVCLHN